jgi:glutamate synthase (NADPH/NADH) small chain
LRRQAGRCMDCGIPFCHSGCPLGNLIPSGTTSPGAATGVRPSSALHATNNFPEFTGRLCPAPCETACVLGINQPAVTIKQVEVTIDRAGLGRGLGHPAAARAAHRQDGRGRRLRPGGPGRRPAADSGRPHRRGLRAGRQAGGLLRYGIPEFKMEKSVLDRRLDQMEAEGTRFRCGVDVGGAITGDATRDRYDAVVLAIGATVRATFRSRSGRWWASCRRWTSCRRPTGQRSRRDASRDQVTAAGKDVIVIGGGDTGADCIGTSHRQGAGPSPAWRSCPSPGRPARLQPWPTYPMIFRVASAHEEGGERVYAVSTRRFSTTPARSAACGSVTVHLDEKGFEPVEGTERSHSRASGLAGHGLPRAQQAGLVEQLGVDLDERGNVERDASLHDLGAGCLRRRRRGRGQSLIVWAIAEGRSAARAVDKPS